MRYYGWREIKGDFNGSPEAAELLDFGKKLLGALDNQRQLSGGAVKTLSRRVELPAGIVFAAFYGAIPVIEVYPRSALAKEIVYGTIEGFVVRLATAADITSNGVDQFKLLDPLQQWKMYYYESAGFVGDVSFKVGTFKTDSGGKPLFQDGVQFAHVKPHSDSLENSGNVDWRNFDESLIVSWFGPNTRYFADQGPLSYYVFFHGQVLFDCSILSGDSFFGNTHVYSTTYAGRAGAVIGACVTPSMDLLVVVRFGAQNGAAGERRDEFLVKLKTVTSDQRGVTGPQAATWKLQPAIAPSTIDGNPEILWSQTLADDIDDEEHPWFFNSTGTEARSIRYLLDVAGGEVIGVKECILTKGAKDVWKYSEKDHDAAVITTSAVTTGTAARFYYSQFGFTFCLPTSTDPPIAGCGIVVGDGYAIDGTCTNDLPVSAVYAGAKTCDAKKVVCAVDFVGSTPIYAYGVPPTFSETGSTHFLPTWDLTGTATYSGGWGGDVTFSSTYNISGGSTYSSSFTHTGITGGIITPWQTLSFDSTENQTANSDALVTLTQSGSETAYWFPGVWPYWTGPGGTGTGSPAGGCGFSPYGTPAYTVDVTYSYVQSSNDVTFKLLYLDLRYGWLVYRTRTVEQTANLSLSLSDSASSPGSLATTAPVTGTTDQTVTLDYYVTLNGTVLSHTTVVDSDTSTSHADHDFDTGVYSIGTLLPWAVGVLTDGRDFRLSATVPGRTCATLYATPASLAEYDVSSTSSTSLGLLQPVPAYVFSDDGISWATTHDNVGPFSPPIAQRFNYGSYQSYKNTWCFSGAMPDGDKTVANFVFKSSNTNPEDFFWLFTALYSFKRYHPIFVLPSVKY